MEIDSQPNNIILDEWIWSINIDSELISYWITVGQYQDTDNEFFGALDIWSYSRNSIIIHNY